MAEDVILYDLNQGDYPRKLGKSIRSMQVCVCPVCGAKTNKVDFAGGFVPGVYTRFLCPHCGEDWHIAIEDAMQSPNPDLAAIEKMRSVIAHLATDDIVGEPDFSEVRSLGIPQVHRLDPERQAEVDAILARAGAKTSKNTDTNTEEA